VVRSWMAGFAGFSNWLGQNHFPGSEATISAALAMAPAIPWAAGVRTRSAPKDRTMARRSRLIDSGITKVSG